MFNLRVQINNLNNTKRHSSTRFSLTVNSSAYYMSCAVQSRLLTASYSTLRRTPRPAKKKKKKRKKEKKKYMLIAHTIPWYIPVSMYIISTCTFYILQYVLVHTYSDITYSTIQLYIPIAIAFPPSPLISKLHDAHRSEDANVSACEQIRVGRYVGRDVASTSTSCIYIVYTPYYPVPYSYPLSMPLRYPTLPMPRFSYCMYGAAQYILIYVRRIQYLTHACPQIDMVEIELLSFYHGDFPTFCFSSSSSSLFPFGKGKSR